MFGGRRMMKAGLAMGGHGSATAAVRRFACTYRWMLVNGKEDCRGNNAKGRCAE